MVRWYINRMRSVDMTETQKIVWGLIGGGLMFAILIGVIGMVEADDMADCQKVHSYQVCAHAIMR